MAEPLVIIGAGGFGRETIDVVAAINDAAGSPVWNLSGVIDDLPSALNLARLEARQCRYLGTVDELIGSRARPRYVVGIGAPQVRRRIATRLDEACFRAASLVHPDATLGRPTEIGPGSVICAGARVSTNVRIGRHVHLNPNTTVGHDTVLADFVSLNPASSISGDCVVEDEVLVGVAAAVLNQLTVGRGALIGGAACVVRDVPPTAVVKGVPAR